jgi:hypothetical protein
LSNKLLCKLRSIKHQDWQFIIGRDVSGFHHTTDYENIWLQPGQEPPEMPRHAIEDEKIMVMIARNALGFHILDAFPKEGYLMPTTPVTIFPQHWLPYARRQAGKRCYSCRQYKGAYGSKVHCLLYRKQAAARHAPTVVA